MDRTSGSAAIRPWRNFRSERYRACQDFATVLVDQDVLLETHAPEPAQSVNAIPVDVVAITLSRQQCFDEVKARLDRPGLARLQLDVDAQVRQLWGGLSHLMGCRASVANAQADQVAHPVREEQFGRTALYKRLGRSAVAARRRWRNGSVISWASRRRALGEGI